MRLRARGLDVSILTYHPLEFFLPLIEAAGIEYTCVESRSVPQRILAIRRWLRKRSHDVVLAFLDASNLYAELAALPMRKWGLVVSERSAISHGVLCWFRNLHRVADYVTTNSHTNRLMIEGSVPALSQRTITLYNAVDLGAFSPPATPQRDDATLLRLVVAARYDANKNPAGLVEAIAIARRQAAALDIRLDWYGDRAGRKGDPKWNDAYDECRERLPVAARSRSLRPGRRGSPWHEYLAATAAERRRMSHRSIAVAGGENTPRSTAL